MKEIKLTQGKITIVDDEDYEMLSQWRWQYNSGYASRQVRVNGGSKKIYMHRLIMHTPEDMDTDHINHNKLDNRRSNLRTCTKSQNSWNRKIQYNNTTGEIGIYWEAKRHKWRSTIMINRKTIRLGRFDNIDDAIKAYKNKARELRGEYFQE